MVVLDTLGDALTLLRRYPKLLAYLVAVATVANVINSGELLDLSRTDQLLLEGLSFVVGPAIGVGSAGLVDDTVTEGRVSGGAFTASVLRNYIPWVAALLFLAFASVVVAFVFFVAFQIPLVNLLSALAFLVLVVAAVLTLQFVDLAIVVDDEGPVEGIRRSYEVATNHLGTVVGYTLLESVFVAGIAIPLIIALFRTGFPDARSSLEPTPELLVAFTVAVLGGVVLETWRVLFYRRLSDRTSR